ncbi:MAG: hypothetical protein AB1656_09270 [Candidatus Omnitrophota bacterium]
MDISRRIFLQGSAAGAVGGLSMISAKQAVANAPSDPIKIRVIFLAKPVPTWPTPHLDVQKEIGKLNGVLSGLKRDLPDISFEGGELLRVAEDVPKALPGVQEADGVLMFNLTSTVGHLVRAIADAGKPALLFSQPYSGHDWSAIADMQKEGKRIDAIASSNYRDLIAGIRPLRTVKRLSQSKILVLRKAESDATESEERLGVRIVPLQHDLLMRCYESVDGKEAEKEADRWIEGAVKVVEPTREEIIKSSRFYLAMKKAMEEENAQGIAINCLGLFYAKKLPAYPCLGFSRLNSEGLVGACEADVQSALTMLLFQYLTGKPGFISDPVIDTANNTVIHAHCVAATRMAGTRGKEDPYILRSHLEDDKGAALQVKMQIGRKVTMAKVVSDDLMLLSTGEITGNPDVDRGCRTKIATKVADARKVLQQYSHGLHRVIFYDDHCRDVESLSKYLGFKIVYET